MALQLHVTSFIVAILSILSACPANGQVFFSDNFNSYTSGNPSAVWNTTTVNPPSGTPPFFSAPVLSGTNRVLRSNGPTSGSGTRRIYASTPCSISNLNSQAVEWRFEFWYNVAWNSTNVNADNHARVFLTSDVANIDGNLNGYHLRLLENIQLWRNTPTSATNLNLSGGTLTDLSTLPQPIQVQVIRLPGGRWLVFVNGMYQGSAVDNSYTSSQFFGFHYRYSAATRNTAFQVDNVLVQRYENTVPTTVVAANGANARQIRIRFNELMDIAALRQSAVFSISGVPAWQVLPAEDEFSVYVNFPFDFVAGNNYLLQCQHLTDIFGNVSASIPDFNFNFNDILPPKVLQLNVVAPQSLDVLFDEPVELTSATTLANYSWNSEQPRAAVRDATNTALVHLLFNNHFPENSNQTLSIVAVKDLQSNAMLPTSAIFHRDTRAPTVNDLTGWRFLSATQIEITFSEPVEPITAELVNNYSLSNGIGFPLQVERNPTMPHKVVLTFAQPIPANVPLTLRITGVRDLAGNAMSTNNITVRYDPDAPEWTQLIQRADNVIELQFNEAVNPATVVTAHFQLTNITDNQIIPIISASLCPINSAIVYLTTVTSLPNDKNFSLQVQNITDLGNNSMPAQSRSFNTIAPKVGEAFILGKNAIEIRFTEAVQPVSALNAANYTLSGVSNVPTINLISPEKVRLVYSIPMEQGQTYRLTVHNIADLNGNLMPSTTISLHFGTYVEEVFLRTSKLLEVIFSEEMPIAEVQNENRYFINGDPARKPVSAVRNTQNPTVVTLLFSDDFVENQTYKLTLGGFATTCRRYVPQSEHEFVLDRRPPQIVSVRVLSPLQVAVEFNKSLDRTTAEAVNHYEISHGIGRPRKATLRGKIVELELSSRLLGNISYTLTARNVQDVLRNTMPVTAVSFQRPAQPRYGELIFTEILADPTPAVGLPSTEFVEIFNNSTQSFELTGISFADESGSTLLGEGTIAPGEYLILCPDEAVEQWQLFGRAVGLKSWRSLTNSGETIRLVDMDGKTIDSVQYSSSWYRDPKKRNGGWSLERISLKEVSCTPFENWHESIHQRGGTPGKPNSVLNNPPDKTPPKIATVTILSNRLLQVRLTKAVERSVLARLANYQLMGASPARVQHATPLDTLNVRLQLASALDSGKQYRLIINHLADCFGNAAADTFSLGIGRYPKKGDLRISEIMANPNAPAGSTTLVNYGEYVEITNLTPDLIQLQFLKLGYENRFFSLPARIIAPYEVLVLTSTARATNFGSRGIGIVGFPALADGGALLTLTDTAEIEIDAVRYSSTWYGDREKQRGGWSLEIIDLHNFCAEEQNWRASLHASGGTPGAPNSVRGTIQDEIPPRVTGVALQNQREVLLSFSEPISLETLLQPSAYAFTQGIRVAQVKPIHRRQVRLLLEQSLDPALPYRLQISGLRDCAGNLITPSVHQLGIGRNPRPKDLLITEILADETPKVGLPAAEFIEIFNNSDDLINLQNVYLADENTTVPLPGAVLLPRQYAVLCAPSRVDSFLLHRPAPQRVIGVVGFPSLSNAGERLRLFIGNLILHQVHYSIEWYRDLAKRNGGWSLEMIDTENFCSEMDNWTASMDPQGGTPGQPNSVAAPNPDKTSPELTRLQLEGSRLTLTFSEKMDSTTLVTLQHYRIKPEIAIRQLVLHTDRVLTVELAESPQAGQLYELELSPNLKDCAGNSLGESSLRVLFGVGRSPERYELLISEIMADPAPSVGLPEREYIELYNATGDLLTLNGIVLIKPETGTTVHLPSLVMPAQSYLVLASSSAMGEIAAASPWARVVGLAGFPSLSNTGETLEIRHLGKLIHSVSYRVEWHQPHKRNGGWSLEMIDLNQPCQQATNWTSSNDQRGGTPGKPNSVHGPNPDLEPPKIVEISLLNSRTLRLVLNEPMDSASLVQSENYHFSAGLLVDSLQVVGVSTVVIKLLEPVVRGKPYQLKIKGLKDCSGNLIQPIEPFFGLGIPPNKFELLISELMADPSPVVGLPESEYVEIFNASDKVISLKGVTLSNSNGTRGILPEVNLLPRTYALICPTSAATVFRSILPTNSAIVSPHRWAALDNTSDVVQLRNAEGLLLHQVAYRAAWISHPSKREGGWSLEMRNLNNPCAGRDNWEASEHPNGGTPAAPNSFSSTLLDQHPPQLQRVETADGQQVRIVLNEWIDSLAATQASYLVNGQKASKVLFSYSRPNEVLVILPYPLKPGEKATLQVLHLRDCVGNTLFRSPIFHLVAPQEAAAGDVIINEILFNPPPTGVDFVELYNKSDKYINLQNWRIANATTERLISQEVLIMPPQTYLVLTPDVAKLKQQYSRAIDSLLHQVNLPSFNDKEGTVRLLNAQGMLIDRLEYSQGWHFALLERKEGVSLERISFHAPTQERNNWHSAAAPFYGTPTYLNSQSEKQSPLVSISECFRIENQVFTPDGDGFQDLMLLHLDCAATGSVATVRIFDSTGRLVRTLLNQQTIAAGMFLAWDGITEEGSKARLGPYIVAIELFDLQGNLKREYLKVVVGAF